MPAETLVPVTAVASSQAPPGGVVDASLTDAAAAAAAATAALASYTALPATGKPPAGQWTVLAGFVAVERDDGGALVTTTLSLGSGSKCVGADRRSPRGDVVNDGHAEAMARRGFVRWLLHELAPETGGTRRGRRRFGIYERGRGRPSNGAAPPPHSLCRRLPHWALHLIVTAPPCGDAALAGAGRVTGARRIDVAGGTGDSRRCTTTAIDVGDQASGDATGLARRKPGRGPATLSMSCSDKVARWTCLGVQGALASRLLMEPVYIDAVTVLDGGVACGDGGGAAVAAAPSLRALQRALVDRVAPLAPRLELPYAWRPPCLHIASAGVAALAALNLAPSPAAPTPAPTAISWCRVRDAGGNWCAPDVVHGSTGRKAGATRATVAAPAVSRVECFKRWARAVAAAGGRLDPALTYGAAKRTATCYTAAWAALRAPPSPLGPWLAKPAARDDEFGLEES